MAVRRTSKRTKFIFVTGGVASSLGKGLCAASMGALLENRGLNIGLQKLDPYLNVDPGHDEPDPARRGVRHRRRRRDRPRPRSLRALRVAPHVAAQQLHLGPDLRGGDPQGATRRLPRPDRAGHPARHQRDQGVHPQGRRGLDLLIVEIGGTVGDIESLPFLEAIRQLRFEVGPENAVFVHLTLLPYLATAGELKTKPTQHSVMKLREIGIQPDILVCRTDHPIERDVREKIALFTNVELDAVISAPEDLETIYRVPLALHEGLDVRLCELLNIWSREPDSVAVAAHRQHAAGPPPTRQDRDGRQVRRSRRVLQEPVRGPGPRRDRQRGCGGDRATSTPRRSRVRGADALLAGTRGCWCPVASASAAARARSRRSATRARIRSRSSASALGMQMAVVEFARHVADIPGTRRAASSRPTRPHRSST
jgi:CTP synthase